MNSKNTFRDGLLQEGWNRIHGKEWKRIVKIGSGSYGSVYIGQRVDDQMVFAVKSTPLIWAPLDPSITGHINALRNEIKSLSNIRCKYIVRMLGCGRSDGTNSTLNVSEQPMLDMFMEYVPRGSLHHLMRRLQLGLTTAKSDLTGTTNQAAPPVYTPLQLETRKKRLPEAYVRAYAADILSGVDYLHRKQLVHGDIKPLNLLVAEDCLKLADFGGCKTLKSRRADTFQTRTTAYAAPEVYYKIEQGLASDIFSVGCVVLEMSTGTMPETLFIPQWLSRDGQNFLRRCLTSDPSKRWTAAQLLEHPFVRDRDHNDHRPYSTVIPPAAERMILQPPPIELYTNTMLSPTYRGNQAPLPPIDPQRFDRTVYGNQDRFRKEKIEISVQPTVSPDDLVSLSLSANAAPTTAAAANAASATAAATSSPGLVTSSIQPWLITSNPGSRPQATVPAPPDPAVASLPRGNLTTVQHPVQLRVAAAAAAAHTTSPSKSVTKPAEPTQPPGRRLKIESRPELGYRTSPEAVPIIESSHTTRRAPDSSHHGARDGKEPELPVQLPEYKPEFVPPEDKSLHFLLAEPPLQEKEMGKPDDLDARAGSGAAGPKPVVMKPPRPAPLVIRGQSPDHPSSEGGRRAEPGYVTLLPRAISHLSEQEIQQLSESLQYWQECNQEIREEARLAEEAGIYDNKLCPSATNEDLRVPKRVRSHEKRTYNQQGFKHFVKSLLHHLNCMEAASSDNVYSPSRRRSP